MFEKKNILGVGFNKLSKEKVLEYIIKSVQKGSEKYYIVTPNPELLVIASRNNEYKKILNKAKLALPDGVGVVLASKLLRKGIKERITGVDLLINLCKRVAEKPITVGFLGGGPGVAEKTADCLRLKYPNLKISFINKEWNKEGFVLARERQVGEKRKEKISNTKYSIYNTVDILFVAFGSPKQEIWISKHLKDLPVRVAIGVGGAFDFISGKVKRAPLWMRNLGLEWLFRLIIQPWRVRRQFSLLIFLFLILKEKFWNSQ